MELHQNKGIDRTDKKIYIHLKLVKPISIDMSMDGENLSMGHVLLKRVWVWV